MRFAIVVLCGTLAVAWLYTTMYHLPYKEALKFELNKRTKALAQVKHVCDNPDVVVALQGNEDCALYRAQLTENPYQEASDTVLKMYGYNCARDGCFTLSINWLTLIGLILPSSAILGVLTFAYIVVAGYRQLQRSSELPSYNKGYGGGHQYGVPAADPAFLAVIVDQVAQRITGAQQSPANKKQK